MRVLVARHGGFCFGVRRAVELALAVDKTGGRVYTLGSIIHNERVVDELGQRGVVPTEDLG